MSLVSGNRNHPSTRPPSIQYQLLPINTTLWSTFWWFILRWTKFGNYLNFINFLEREILDDLIFNITLSSLYLQRKERRLLKKYIHKAANFSYGRVVGNKASHAQKLKTHRNAGHRQLFRDCRTRPKLSMEPSVMF